MSEKRQHLRCPFETDIVLALPDLHALLEAQLERTRVLERDGSRVIPHVFHRNGAPIRTFRKAWESACRRAGLEGKLPYDFRRTAVRNLERAGVPRSVAMRLVGHKTESIYRRYAIVSARDLSDGVARLAQLLGDEGLGGRRRLVG